MRKRTKGRQRDSHFLCPYVLGFRQVNQSGKLDFFSEQVALEKLVVVTSGGN